MQEAQYLNDSLGDGLQGFRNKETNLFLTLNTLPFISLFSAEASAVSGPGFVATKDPGMSLPGKNNAFSDTPLFHEPSDGSRQARNA